MRNKRPLVLLLLACCLAQPVFGQISYGSRDCGQWIKRMDSATTKNAVESWFAGYMSGINMMYVTYSKREDALNKVDSLDQMILWMDNYCNKNHLNRASTGALELFLELAKK